MTKIQKILKERRLSQRDLQRLIYEKHEFFIGEDRISKIVNGKITNLQLKTAKIIAESLDLKIEDISEI